MDLDEDVDYELMQQYEDQLYGGQKSQESESEGLDSDVEDAVLSRLYYTSNASGTPVSNEQNSNKEQHRATADSLPQSALGNGRKRGYNQLSSSESDREEEQLHDYDGSPALSEVEKWKDDSRQASCEAESDVDDDSDEDSIAFTPAKDDDIPVTKIIDLAQPVEMNELTKDTEEYSYMDDAAFQDRNRYFQDEEGRKQQSARAACYICGQLGHQQRDCPMCKVCKSLDHRTRDCTANILCFKCKKMGHRSADCTNQSAQECRRCGSLLHNHEDCPSIWRIYKVTVKKNPRNIWCCHCAAPGHSYLDCDAKNSFAIDRIKARDTGRRDHVPHYENTRHRRHRSRSPPNKIQKSSRRSDTSDRRSRYDDRGSHRRDEQVSYRRHDGHGKQDSYKKPSNHSKPKQRSPHSNHTPANYQQRNSKDPSRRSEPKPTRSGTMQLPNANGRRNDNSSYSNNFPRNPPKLPQPTSSGIIGLPPQSRGSPRYHGGYRAAV